jgi:pimeloyl-ACP methyl ester carboxylesterase
MNAFLLVHGKFNGPEDDRCPLKAVADELTAGQFLVNYSSYPWSIDRNYDATSMQAAEEIHANIQLLKTQGATRIHIVAFSMGANLALYYSTLDHQDYDSIVAMAPAHNIHSEKFQHVTHWCVEKAIGMANIFDDTPTHFIDSQKGSIQVAEFLPSVYASFFDPAGPCNMVKSVAETKTAKPVYIIIGSEDTMTVNTEQLLFVPMLKDESVSKFESLQGIEHSSTPLAALPKFLSWVNTF